MSPSQAANPTHTTPALHTYHCLCATLLLCTPYSITSLPTRAPPSLDKARILPLPPIHTTQNLRSSPPRAKSGNTDPAADDNAVEDDDGDEEEEVEEEEGRGVGRVGDQEKDGGGDGREKEEYLPSLILPALRPARKLIMVRREDGWERRRVWRCARCGLGVGYEVEGEDAERDRDREGKGTEGERTRVMFLLEGGLVETGEWEGKDGGLEVK